MKIAVGQINATTGDFRGNLRRIKSCVEDATGTGAELVVFPACALTGWEPLDLSREEGFLRHQAQALHSLSGCADVGAVLLGHVSEQGTGECVASLIDEQGSRVVATASEPGRVQVKGHGVGVVVGEAPQVPLADCELLVCLQARPFRLLERNTCEAEWAELARGSQAPLLHVNLVGGNGEAVFPGSSTLFDPEGRATARAARFAPDTALFDTDAESGPAPGNEDNVVDLYAALRLGLRDFVQKNGFRDAVLGLSGGIDSAVVAALAADALGADHVVALIMPTRFSSRASREAAEAIAGNLGVHCRLVPIEELRVEFEEALSPIFAGTERGTAEENIQARIRGLVQMAYANKFGAMPLATGNRSELAVGYCTLYGDMTGGLAVIGDVPKTWVYGLAQYINKNGELIPQFVIERPPSAELKPDQKDQDVLPPYETLDSILECYLDEGLSPEQIVAGGFDAERVDETVTRLKRAGFKRIQAPPLLRVYSVSRWPRFPLAGRLLGLQTPLEEAEDG